MSLEDLLSDACRGEWDCSCSPHRYSLDVRRGAGVLPRVAARAGLLHVLTTESGNALELCVRRASIAELLTWRPIPGKTGRSGLRNAQ